MSHVAHSVRTHLCGDLRADHVGQTITLAGWVHRRRDHGGLIFVDVRDRTGIVQCVFAPETGEAFAIAERLRPEWVVLLEGVVRARPEGTKNPEMPTGEVEVAILSATILNTAETPPFEVSDGIETDETTRMRYRYVDIRRPEMLSCLVLRDTVAQAFRRSLGDRGFLEVETPILTKSTPEGARDFIVPSRMNPGKFYALPQSPQLFKQLLMVGGADRYYQIARCFRDEDLRADRQPEFTQIDIEMSFCTQEHVLATVEEVMAEVMAAAGAPWSAEIPRVTYAEAMDRFGSDRPDTRFGMELHCLTSTFANSQFKVFSSALGAGGRVKGINAKGAGDWSRGRIDALNQLAIDNGAKGLAWVAFPTDGDVRSPVAKFFSAEEIDSLRDVLAIEPGDLALIVADQHDLANVVLGVLRVRLAEEMGLAASGFHPLWVVDFPLFAWDEEEKRYTASHHPFTRPFDEHVNALESDPASVLSYSYDLVINGLEIGGGTLRVHDTALQRRIFTVMGLDEAEAADKFGFLLEALASGAPPHGGIAFGFDRLVMLLAGGRSIRDVIAFPKTSSGACPLTGAPDAVSARQLKEVHLKSE
ncbi:MAG: aspartate--tRNA ligase [Clostridiales bacterium]|nr:aspartate--tRNA ligase [Clostridiales bacterium]